MQDTVKVNGHDCEVGCWIDGHWGQYGPDRLIQIGMELGYEPIATLSCDGVLIRVAQRRANQTMPDLDDLLDEYRACRAGIDEPTEADMLDHVIEVSEDIEKWLNDHTPPRCEHCHRPMHIGSDGFYFHDDVLVCEAGIRATLDPERHYWSWEDGEFYLQLQEEDE